MFKKNNRAKPNLIHELAFRPNKELYYKFVKA